MKKKPILMIDDDPLFLQGYQSILQSDFDVLAATSVTEGIKLMELHSPSVLLLDISMNTEREGLDILPYLKEQYPGLAVVVVTNWDSHLIFKEAMQKGADDFFIKSDNLDYLKTVIENQLFNGDIKSPSSGDVESDFPLAYSPPMVNVLASAKKAAATRCPVLITGETGVGKEVVAQYIHKQSKRRKEAFVAVNCAAIPEQLVESELFGYDRGAFTGAVTAKSGKFEIANGGTLFLDEIEGLSPKAQAALLRVTQDLKLEHLGGTKTISVDVRIIGATLCDLKELVKQSKFREDLYYRLAVFSIHIPALRERKVDILPLSRYFLKKACQENQLPEKEFSHSALLMLKTYYWPGNVRELRNTIEQSAVLSQEKIIRSKDLNLPCPIQEPIVPYEVAKQNSVRDFKEQFFKNAILRNNGNLSAISRETGISRQALQKILKELNLNSK